MKYFTDGDDTYRCEDDFSNVCVLDVDLEWVGMNATFEMLTKNLTDLEFLTQEQLPEGVEGKTGSTEHDNVTGADLLAGNVGASRKTAKKGRLLG